MQRERWLKVKELRDHAETLPPEKRRVWLEEACAGDTSLFRETIALLEEDEGQTSHMTAIGPVTPTGELAGILLGSWRLLREIGRGGMGAVWLAERADSEFSMPAAVKFIKTIGTESKLVKRFRRERQFLADLRHPNIAILLDGGTNKDGLPYLVMEYVDGWTIDTWCDVNTPSMPELMSLFRQVCLAVGYTHRKGVLHRDIKPANIMITGDQVPKLMDFGIAGWIAESDDDDMDVFGCYPITPEYASPERLRGERPQTSCDLYALGLVLFRLLGGRRPRGIEGNYADFLRDQIEPDDKEGPLKARAAELVEVLTLPDIAGRLIQIEDLLARCDALISGEKPRPAVIEKSEPAEPAYHAMLWYHDSARKEAETLARRLEDEGGLRVWLDQWHLVPGDEVPTALAAAMDESACLLVPLTEDRPGPWMNETQRMALSAKLTGAERRIVPLLLPGARRPQRESVLPAFLRRRAWAEITDNESYRQLESLVLAIRGLPPGRPDGAQTLGACPFRGLEAFREDDRHFFFGREAITQRLVDHMARFRFLAVLGASGSGKSSVVQAGLVPRLRERGDALVLFTPSAEPLEELTFGLAAHLAPMDVEVSNEEINRQLQQHDHALHDLAVMLHLAGGPARLCLVIDQFEEVFTLARDKERTARFLANILHAVEQPGNHVSVVLTMRSDFLDKTGDFLDLDDYITEQMIHIKAMSREELSRAVTEPARLAGLSFESGLVEKILDDVYGGAGELPLLEHALLELYHRRRGKLLTAAAYAEIGGIEGALARRAEQEFLDTEESGQDMMRRMFTLCLVQPGEGGEDTRRRATRAELLTVAGKVDEADGILQRLVKARLLTVSRDEVRAVDMVDVAHEALIRRWQRIGSWMDQNREKARLLDRLRRSAHAWEEAGRHSDLLLRGAPLLQVCEMVDRKEINLTVQELDFIHAAEAMQELEAKRELEVARSLLWRSRAIGILVLVGLLAVSTMAWRLREERDTAEQKATELEKVTKTVEDLFLVPEDERAAGHMMTVDDMIDRSVSEMEDQDDNPEFKTRLKKVFGRIYYNRGRYSQSAELWKEALDDTIRVLGPDDPEIPRLQLQLGSVLLENGNLKEAETLLRESLANHNRFWGEKDLDTAVSQSALARVLYRKREYEEAESLFRQALDLHLDLLGEDKDTAKIMQNLGGSQRKLGQLDKAEATYTEALRMLRKLLGDEHRDIAGILNSMAGLYNEKGNKEKAEELYRQALGMNQKLLGEEHPSVATNLNNLALLLFQKGDYYGAEDLYRRVLDMRHRVLPPTHPHLADSIYSLGFTLHRLKDYEGARALYFEELNIRQIIKREKNINLAYCYESLGAVHKDMGAHAQAGEMFRKALLMWRDLGGGDLRLMVNAGRLAESMALQGYFERASTVLGQVRGILESRAENSERQKANYRSLEGLIRVGRGERGEVFLDMAAAWTTLVCLNRRIEAAEARARLVHAYRLAEKNDQAIFWSNEVYE
ncbi:MAG: tetratricopeptide repeat protein [Acidobacteriota bacterium]|nr:tetratricopeptide repeat protein [Acidobacteriota bacterium]